MDLLEQEILSLKQAKKGETIEAPLIFSAANQLINHSGHRYRSNKNHETGGLFLPSENGLILDKFTLGDHSGIDLPRDERSKAAIHSHPVAAPHSLDDLLFALRKFQHDFDLVVYKSKNGYKLSAVVRISPEEYSDSRINRAVALNRIQNPRYYLSRLVKNFFWDLYEMDLGVNEERSTAYAAGLSEKLGMAFFTGSMDSGKLSRYGNNR